MDKLGDSGDRRGPGREKSTKLISDFFSKRPKLEVLGACVGVGSETAGNMGAATANSDGAIGGPESQILPVSSGSKASFSHGSVPLPSLKYDIGLYVKNKHEIDDLTKKQLIETPWTPDKNYKFPFSSHIKNGKPVRRFAGHQHLGNHHWLSFSHTHQGFYCKYCVLFAPESAGDRASTSLNVFVKRPLTVFAKLYGKDGALTIHEGNRYHLDAVVSGKNFLKSLEAPELNVSNQINSQRLAQINENRARLRPIVESIIFCGQQNIALRGHRDDGSLKDTISEEGSASIVANDGNFRALLRFRAAGGDTVLASHLETACSNATYISKTTQNELINCCGDEIVSKICERVQNAGWFAIIFDETTDAAHIEQMSISLRYVYETTIREDFVTFVDCYDQICPEDVENSEKRLTGEALAHIVINVCKKLGLDLYGKCVGVGTDNCSVMASQLKGAAKIIRDKAPMAIRCPCFSHSLNNSLKATSKELSCKTAISKMKEVISFSKSSAKLNAVFKRHLHSAFSGLCETRWQEKHHGVLQFCQNMRRICEALEEISNCQASESSSKAYSLLKAVCDSEFIVTSFALGDILSTTRTLSLALQKPSLDAVTASNMVKDTIAVLQSRRSLADDYFIGVFKMACEAAADVGCKLEVPRVTTVQKSRPNHPFESPEEYYRRSIFIPLLDATLSDLKDRFSDDILGSFNLRILLPSCMKLDRDSDLSSRRELKILTERYSTALGEKAPYLEAEYTMWVERFRRIQKEGGKIPKTIMDVIENCDKDLYPCIFALLSILATLPISVATAERSFSTLRRLKTWLRSRMGEDRLNGLALLHIHRDIICSAESVIDRYARRKKRKLEFLV